MQHKLKQQVNRFRFTTSNRLPLAKSRKYLLNFARAWDHANLSGREGSVRVGMALLRWLKAETVHDESRISYRAGCFLTGRNRGTSQRFSIARTKIKEVSNSGTLLGVRKSSW